VRSPNRNQNSIGFISPLTISIYFQGAIANGDPIALGKIFYVYGKSVFDNTLHSATSLFHHYKDKATKFEL
jgi:hypothetical protein